MTKFDKHCIIGALTIVLTWLMIHMDHCRDGIVPLYIPVTTFLIHAVRLVLLHGYNMFDRNSFYVQHLLVTFAAGTWYYFIPGNAGDVISIWAIVVMLNLITFALLNLVEPRKKK